MNARKTQNSIIALATLGVYLGLLLAGAAPGVLAQQAALTKQFNVNDEIERKDDLDKKPDDERSPVTTSVQIYLEDVEYFLASLSRLQSKGKFDLAKDKFWVAKSTALPCVAANKAGRYTPARFDVTNDALRPSLEIFSRGMEYGYSLGDCLANNEFSGIEAVDSRFSYSLDNKAFDVNVAVKKQSPQTALELIKELEGTLRLYDTPDSTKLRKAVIANTRFTSDNDQVSVVTRLPRGSLDTLLALDAK
ncbi:MAG: hypothetical protein ACKVQW_13390 [Pyrinomonadaceae bacterium]